MMLADELSPNPSAIGNWLIVLSFIVSIGSTIVVAVMAVVSGRKTQKREIAFTEVYASREEVSEIHQDFQEFRRQAQFDREAAIRTGEERATKIHDRINEVLEAVSELRGVVSEIKRV